MKQGQPKKMRKTQVEERKSVGLEKKDATESGSWRDCC